MNVVNLPEQCKDKCCSQCDEAECEHECPYRDMPDCDDECNEEESSTKYCISGQGAPRTGR